MATVHICEYDSSGRIKVVREDFDGPHYPGSTSKVRKTVLVNQHPRGARRQQAQWSNISDEDARERAVRLAADYKHCEG